MRALQSFGCPDEVLTDEASSASVRVVELPDLPPVQIGQRWQTARNTGFCDALPGAAQVTPARAAALK